MTPGLIAAIAAFCAPSTTSYNSRCRGVTFPLTGTVRVMSLAYIEHSAATSISKSSPVSIRRRFWE